jgi:hypothetical protein
LDAEDVTLLCRACGLCCDGSLFGRVPLAPEEVPRLRGRRLAIVGSPGRPALEQPCGARSEAGCAIYAERPGACRRFVCRLADRHRREEGSSLEACLAVVVRTKELLARVVAAGPANQNQNQNHNRHQDGTLDAAGRERAELAARLADDFARA